MNKKTNISKIFFSIFAGALLLSSCAKEDPFNMDEEGVLKMNTEVRGNVNIVTKADIQGYTTKHLEDNLVVYIENNKGVIRKYIGKDQIPQAITLPVGQYIVEGWTGDSVSASWDKKFFRGYEKVSVGNGNNELSLKLDIANVLVKVDESSLIDIQDLQVKFYHSRGELNFTDKEINGDSTGYFMMPNADPDLHYVIEGKNKLNESFRKTGDIKGVQRAHLYNLKLTSEQPENSLGGAIIRLIIEDIPVIEETFEILPAPSFKATYSLEDWDLDNQLISTGDTKDFKDLKVRVLVYESLKNLTISFDSKIPGMSGLSGINTANGSLKGQLESKNIELEIIENETEKSSIKDHEDVKAILAYITFKSEFLNSLAPNEEEYQIILAASDGRNYSNTATIKIANTENAIFHQDPIASTDAPSEENSPMDVLSNSAVVSGYLYDTTVADYGILYREKNSEVFKKVSAKNNTLISRAAGYSTFSVKLTDLKPGTTYEYKMYADQFVEPDSSIKTIKTEDYFKIPNGDMEEWYKNGDVLEPCPQNNLHNYWDTGNHGSTTMNVTLTQYYSNMKSSGNYSAKLRSQFVGVLTIGKFAAGNLFVGKYAKTDGTNGIIDFGQEYNNSHPSGVKVNVNYRPGTVEKTYSNQNVQKKGDIDTGQIYIALATEKITVSTADQSTLFEFQKDTEKVLAYGEYNFTEDFGADNELKELIINFKYKDLAKNVQPKYLIIVCSASKYGDYFTGGEGSTMIVDDFELVYEDIQFEN